MLGDAGMIKKITLTHVSDRFVIEIIDNTKGNKTYSIDTIDPTIAIKSLERYI